ASLTDALAAVPAALRPSTQAISFHAMRRLGTAMAIRSLLIPRKPPSALLDSLVLVSFSLLAQSSPVRADDAGAAQRTGGPSYADHTVVDQAVRAASGHRKLASFKGLVNGALRRFVRERSDILARLDSPEARWNYPAWWIEQIR